MKFAEIPVDTKLIKEMFSETPVHTYLKEIREDFEDFNKDVFVDDISTGSNSISDLQYYKTELFRLYCMGLLSTLTKLSKFNQAIHSNISK